MKKTITIFVMAMFVLSIFPLVYAEDESAANDATLSNTENGKKPLGPVANQRIEMIKAKNEERKETIKNFEECVKAAKEKYPNSSEQKIAQGCKEETGFVTGNEKIRERMKNIGSEDRLNLALKLAEKNPKISEMIANMTDEEAKTFLELNREQQKIILKEGKKALKEYKVKKVAIANAFKKREVAKDKMDKARERFEKAEEKYKNAKEGYKNSKDNFDNAVKAGNNEDAKKYAKEFLTNAADQVISALLKIKENAESNEDLTDSEVAAIISDANEKIAKMESAKTALLNATTKEEIKAAGKEIINVWKRTELSIRIHAAKIVEGKVGEIIKRSESLERKLERVLAKMEEKGINTTSIDPKIDEFSVKIKDAKTLFGEGRELFLKAKEIKVLGNLTETQKTDAEKYLSDSKEKIRKAHETLKEAHQILMEIVKEVKALGGNIETDDEDTEVVITSADDEELNEQEEDLNEKDAENNNVEVNTESVSVSTSDDGTTVTSGDVTVSTSEDGVSVSTGNVNVSTSDDETTVSVDDDDEDDTVVLVGDDDTLVNVTA